MSPLCITLGIIAILALLLLLITYICFRLTFYVTPKQKTSKEEYPIPRGKIYEPYRDTMISWMKEARAMPHEDVSIKSFDGLNLYGKYYECKPGAPIELMLPGYRGNAERDLCGGVQRCFALGRNALIADQRTTGPCNGKVITFGVVEYRDVLSWVDFIIEHFGEDIQIILTGISMGAATVLVAGGRELPKNVIGILADCGYTSPKDIIKKVMTQLHLPANLLYPIVKLGARIYGGFDLESQSPIEAVKRCKVPVIFFHGEDDTFVPCEMSRQNYEACTAPKRILTVPGAGHGLGYLVAPEEYIRVLDEFSREVWKIEKNEAV